MTKKVLISLEDLMGVIYDICSDDCAVFESAAEKWFDAQADVSEITTEKINYSALKKAVQSIEEIEVLIKKYGYEKSDSMHCDHRGVAYDEKRIDRAYAKLLQAIKQYKEQK